MLDDFREWLSDNLRYILLGLAVVLILVIGFCVVRLVTSSSGSSSGSGTAGTETSSGTVTEAQTQSAQTAGTEAETQGSTAAAGTDSLVRDDAAILTLVRQYYTAAAAKDVDTLSTIVTPWNDEVRDSVLRNDVIESYDNISTYSKAGPVDGSYVVFAYYEGKVANIDTPVPSLSMLYLTTDESGNLVVSDRNSSQEVSDYIDQISSDADVQALVADVDQKCEEAMDSDPALREFMETLDTTGSDESSDADTSSNTTVTSGEMVVNTEVLNIRQEANTDSAIMGVITSGTTVTVLQDAGDGWCQISYNAGSYTIEGYVRSEYLVSPGTDTSSDTTQSGETNAVSDTQTSESGSASGTDDTQV